MLDALRKNIRMLWKPNKSIQISLIEEEMYYEKQLVLLQNFEGDKDPKDIIFQWSPFWVQMYNLPLKHRTRETGLAIGASLGEVLEVNVADLGVQWGKCLRVRVMIDVTRRLIRGRKTKVEDGVDWWVLFKYEHLPNFCYRYGLLEHDLKECPKSKGEARNTVMADLQYGAWMRGDPVKRLGWEPHHTKKNGGDDTRGKMPSGDLRIPMVQTSKSSAMGLEKVKSRVQLLGECSKENKTKRSENGGSVEGELQENSKGRKSSEFLIEDSPILVKVGEDRAQATNGKEGSRHEETELGVKECPSFKFELGPTDRIGEVLVGSDPISKEEGLMAMTYEMELGWVTETLDPTSGHWKRRAHVGQAKGKEKIKSPIQMKRGAVTPSCVLEHNGLGRK